MTPSEINTAIQQACGPQLYVVLKRGLYYRPNAKGYTDRIEDAWKLPLEQAKGYEAYADREDIPFNDKVFIRPCPPSNFHGSLDAMHEAEKVLTDDQWDRYDDYLCGLTPGSWNRHKSVIHPAANVKAEAFLRTLNLWKE